jgi:fluoroacetyl-CoA thioesterase
LKGGRDAPGLRGGPVAEPGLAAGARGTITTMVTQADTALAVGSGDVPVLATPRLLAMAEAATVAAIAPRLAAGQTSVGTAARLEHRRPSPVGARVTAEAGLTAVDGLRLTFTFTARHTTSHAGPGAPAVADHEARVSAEAAGRAAGIGRAAGEIIATGTIERVPSTEPASSRAGRQPA